MVFLCFSNYIRTFYIMIFVIENYQNLDEFYDGTRLSGWFLYFQEVSLKEERATGELVFFGVEIPTNAGNRVFTADVMNFVFKCFRFYLWSANGHKASLIFKYIHTRYLLIVWMLCMVSVPVYFPSISRLSSYILLVTELYGVVKQEKPSYLDYTWTLMWNTFFILFSVYSNQIDEITWIMLKNAADLIGFLKKCLKFQLGASCSKFTVLNLSLISWLKWIFLMNSESWDIFSFK